MIYVPNFRKRCLRRSTPGLIKLSLCIIIFSTLQSKISPNFSKNPFHSSKEIPDVISDYAALIGYLFMKLRFFI